MDRYIKEHPEQALQRSFEDLSLGVVRSDPNNVLNRLCQLTQPIDLCLASHSRTHHPTSLCTYAHRQKPDTQLYAATNAHIDAHPHDALHKNLEPHKIYACTRDIVQDILHTKRKSQITTQHTYVHTFLHAHSQHMQ